MRESHVSDPPRPLAVAVGQWRRDAAYAEALVVAVLVIGICTVVYAIGAEASAGAPLFAR